MSHQRHVVKKQIIELRVSTAEDANALQAKVSQIYRRQIVPLLERHCSALSNAGEIIRIDRLEIDLGTLSRKDFEQQWSAALKRQLPEQLSNFRPQASEKSDPSGSALELLDFYLRLGYLPWWADSRAPELLENCLQEALCQPRMLRHQLHHWHSASVPWRRLVNSFTDIHLLSLFRAVAAGVESEWLDRLRFLGQALPGIAKTRLIATAEIRQVFWTEIFAWLRGAQFKFADGEGLTSSLLRSAAGVLQLTAAELLGELIGRGGDANRIRTSRVAETLQTGSVDDPRPAVLASNQRAAVNADVDRELLQDLRRGVLNEERFRLLMNLIVNGQLAPEMVWHLTAAIADSQGGTDNRERLRRLRRALDAYRESRRPETPQSKQSIRRKEDEQAVYIENAGLVIFWPFLPRLFSRLDLLIEKTFRSPQAQYRAVQLLAYLVTGESLCAEYRLPLNKLLCGLDLEGVIVQEQPLSQEEMAECDRLIQALIIQAEVLANTSGEGLRQTFLQRNGVIRQRDGAWLLRVEQETQDILLQRLPWDFGWVKLPWMPWAMRVEWI